MATVAVIGSGFSGLSAAAYLSAMGYSVDVFEKNDTPGGRARTIATHNGYLFDMGPSWYWMPGVFEKFFNDFGYKVSDLYDLQLLDPSFDVVFGVNDRLSIPADPNKLSDLFESIEVGSAAKLHRFMGEARYKYETGVEKLVYKPGLSLFEYMDPQVIKGLLRLQVFTSFSKHIRKFFKHPKLLALMEFPVLFLGAMPEDTPALYSLMNYAGLHLGTWYPKGGFGKVIDAMVKVAAENGARFHYGANVEKVVVTNGKATSLIINGQPEQFDAVVAAADYHHVESKLLGTDQRNYKEEYWDKKTLAPSCLIYYIGLNRKLPTLEHHTLFFEESLLQHSKEIYKQPQWPTKPLFYVCSPSRTDDSIAPEGHENLFFLMPIAPGLEDTPALREQYFQVMLQRLEQHTGTNNLVSYIDYKQGYCINDFITDYNAYKGNAYGLANTLRQTAILKPKVNNRKVSNLFYAGQLTVPGPGVPPSIISGKIAAQQLEKYLKRQKHEAVI